jgi:hypothetical protein
MTKTKETVPSDVILLLQRLINSRALLLHGGDWIEEINKVLKKYDDGRVLPDCQNNQDKE